MSGQERTVRFQWLLCCVSEQIHMFLGPGGFMSGMHDKEEKKKEGNGIKQREDIGDGEKPKKNEKRRAEIKAASQEERVENST